MNRYGLLASIFGEGETGYQNAKLILGVMIICVFIFILAWIVKRLGIFNNTTLRKGKVNGVGIDKMVLNERKKNARDHYDDLNDR